MTAFSDYIAKKSDDLEELNLFTEICERALSRATMEVKQIDAYENALAVLGEPPRFQPGEQRERARARAAEIAALSEIQHSQGSPYLFSLCSIRLWTLLEALVDELVVEAMKDPASCKDQGLLNKLKGPLIEFKASSPQEQAEFLAETLKQAVDAPLKLGVGRFEAILMPVGLGGEVDDRVRRTLFELSQIRNCIVHKEGKADRRLLESCPWLRLSRGQDLRVTSIMFRSYMSAAYWYLVELRGRADERNGSQRGTNFSAVLDSLTELLERSPLPKAAQIIANEPAA